jgi:excinuclease ABC subunit C
VKTKEKKFQFRASKIPTSPGCYLFWDKNEQLLYVGKAKHLRKRVSSYFGKKPLSPRIEIMTSKITKIETRIVGSDMEAMILENNLIKEFQPRFNVRLKDDKNFVYLRITNEDFPKMEITRRLVRDGSTYIGPKTSAKEFRETVRFCQKFFRIKMTKSSLDYYPLVITGGLENDKESYNNNVKMMKQFLRGQTGDVLGVLKEKMQKFAMEKNFEAAAKTRDTIQSIETSTQKQTVQFSDTVNRDFVHFVRHENAVYAVRIAFREGKLLDQNELSFRAEEFLSDNEVVESFLLQFYEKVQEMPSEIYVPVELEDGEKTAQFLSDNFGDGASITILKPQRGEKKIVLDMTAKNAKIFAERKLVEEQSHTENFAKALPRLAEALNLKEVPRRMECFDISHLGGTSTVASQVVFISGEPKKSEYRRFQIQTLPDGKVDDFAAMNEILARRFARKDDKKIAEKFPDLIVIDGGKGQLSSVMKAVARFSKAKSFPKKFRPTKQIIALAKREEEIFLPNKKEPIELPFDDPALKLLQRIRDEAHRFAISFHRSVREKKAIKSVLDDIPGIGGLTKKKLLQTFGSVSGIKKASNQELLKVLNQKQLESLKKNL